jgi:hypothetical protein
VSPDLFAGVSVFHKSQQRRAGRGSHERLAKNAERIGNLRISGIRSTQKVMIRRHRTGPEYTDAVAKERVILSGGEYRRSEVVLEIETLRQTAAGTRRGIPGTIRGRLEFWRKSKLMSSGNVDPAGSETYTFVYGRLGITVVRAEVERHLPRRRPKSS